MAKITAKLRGGLKSLNYYLPTSTALSVNWRLEVTDTQTKPAFPTERYANAG